MNEATEQKMVESITPAEFEHLQKVNADLEQAKAMVNQANAVLLKAQGAQQGHFNYLATAHKLSEEDTVDFSTGVIKRVR